MENIAIKHYKILNYKRIEKKNQSRLITEIMKMWFKCEWEMVDGGKRVRAYIFIIFSVLSQELFFFFLNIVVLCFLNNI